MGVEEKPLPPVPASSEQMYHQRELEINMKRKQQEDDEEEAERKKLQEEAVRMDRTVMVCGLNIKADERDIFEFMTPKAGQIRDVQIIRDARTGRSKGVSFVEFASHEGRTRALALSGQILKGAVIQVQ